jgi:hypothetical protein
MIKKSTLFIFGVIAAAALTTGSLLGYRSGYNNGIQSIQIDSQSYPPSQSQDNANAIVWNTTGLYEEIEDQQPIASLNRCTRVIVEDTAGDFYFIRVEENGVVIASGWASVYNIRLYPDFSNGVECDE